MEQEQRQLSYKEQLLQKIGLDKQEVTKISLNKVKWQVNPATIANAPVPKPPVSREQS